MAKKKGGITHHQGKRTKREKGSSGPLAGQKTGQKAQKGNNEPKGSLALLPEGLPADKLTTLNGVPVIGLKEREPPGFNFDTEMPRITGGPTKEPAFAPIPPDIALPLTVFDVLNKGVSEEKVPRVVVTEKEGDSIRYLLDGSTPTVGTDVKITTPVRRGWASNHRTTTATTDKDVATTSKIVGTPGRKIVGRKERATKIAGAVDAAGLSD